MSQQFFFYYTAHSNSPSKTANNLFLKFSLVKFKMNIETIEDKAVQPWNAIEK